MSIHAATSRNRAILAITMCVAIAALGAMRSSSAAGIQFQDVTTTAGFDKVTTSYGAAWGNLDGDVYPDLFTNNHARRNSIYRNDGHGGFSDVALQVDALGYWAGDGAWEDTHGGSWNDHDNDGDQDLLITTGICCDPQFFENEGGLLYYRSIEKGFGGDVDKGGRMPVWFDADDDGLLETLITSFYPGPYMAQSAGVFNALPWGSTLRCTSNQFAILVDTRGSDDPEIICIDKGGEFVQAAYDVSTTPFTDITADFPPIIGVNDIVLGDYDGDLRTDLFTMRGALRSSEVQVFGDNKLEAQFIDGDRGFSFRSTGVLTVKLDWNKNFTDQTNIWVGPSSHPAAMEFTLDPQDPAVAGVRTRVPKSYAELYIGYDEATQTWHFDQYVPDWGYLYVLIESTEPMSDLVTRNIQAWDGPLTPNLLANKPGGLQDVTAASGLNSPNLCVSGAAGDFDNDMDVDLFLVCRGGVRNIEDRLYDNNGDGTFTLVADAGGARGPVGAAAFDSRGTGDSVVTADYDVDGRLDLFVTNGLNMRPYYIGGGPDQMFRNVSPARRWLEIDLVGTVSNRDGIGAKVFATAGGKTQMREQNGSYHRWSQNHQRIHFGLADNPVADIEIRWPSGAVQTFPGVETGHLYRVTENTGIELIDPDNGDGEECFAPTYSAQSVRAMFIWSDCDGSGRWHVRATAGGGKTNRQYAGAIWSDLGFDALAPFSFETGDQLVNAPDTRRADFVFKTKGSNQDGLDMTLPDGATACFDASTLPPGANVRLGAGQVPVTPPFDLASRQPCTIEDPPDESECGTPPFDPATDNAIVLWRDCGTNRWHLRVAATAYTQYMGSVTAGGSITSVAGVDLESADAVTPVNAQRVDFTLAVKTPGYDGFDFTVPCSSSPVLTVSQPAGANILVGINRTPTSSPVSLATRPVCTP